MSPSTFDSLSPVRELLDKALSLGGLTVITESRSRAIRIRQQIYEARALDRTHSCEAYQIDDERYNKSPYDKLTVVIGKTPTDQYCLQISLLSTPMAGVVQILDPSGNPVD